MKMTAEPKDMAIARRRVSSCAQPTPIDAQRTDTPSDVQLPERLIIGLERDGSESVHPARNDTGVTPAIGEEVGEQEDTRRDDERRIECGE